jgi:signal peptidase
MTEPLYTTEEQIKQMREELERAKNRETAGRQGTDRKAMSRKRLLLPPPFSGRLIRQLLFWATTAFLIYVLVTVLAAKSRGEIPSLLGYQLYVVETGSMSPTLKPGAVILSRKPADAGALDRNEIVTFRMKNGSIVTHRIIEVLADDQGGVLYRTKGDNPVNSSDPELLEPGRVIAVLVVKIPLT